MSQQQNYPAILAGQPPNKVLFIRLFSHLNKVFIFLHSYKNRSILFDFLKFMVFQYQLKTGSFIQECDWLLGVLVTPFSRFFWTSAYICANISLSLSIDEMNHSVELLLVL